MHKISSASHASTVGYRWPVHSIMNDQCASITWHIKQSASMKTHLSRYDNNTMPEYFTHCAGINNTHASIENQMCRYIKYGWPVQKKHVSRYSKRNVPIWLTYRQPAYSCLDCRYIFYLYDPRRYMYIYCSGTPETFWGVYRSPVQIIFLSDAGTILHRRPV